MRKKNDRMSNKQVNSLIEAIALIVELQTGNKEVADLIRTLKTT